MWRAILLGKMSFSILASFVVGVVCASQPWRGQYTWVGSARWIGVGVFFLALGLIQIWVIYFLMKRKT